MLESPTEEPSHFAWHWIALAALAGGVASSLGVLLLFGEESFQTDIVMFGSFFAGAGLGAVAGWKLVIPQRSE